MAYCIALVNVIRPGLKLTACNMLQHILIYMRRMIQQHAKCCNISWNLWAGLCNSMQNLATYFVIYEKDDTTACNMLQHSLESMSRVMQQHVTCCNISWNLWAELCNSMQHVATLLHGTTSKVLLLSNLAYSPRKNRSICIKLDFYSVRSHYHLVPIPTKKYTSRFLYLYLIKV